MDKDEDGCYTASVPDITVEKIVKYRRMGVRSKLYLEEIDSNAHGRGKPQQRPMRTYVEANEFRAMPPTESRQ